MSTSALWPDLPPCSVECDCYARRLVTSLSCVQLGLAKPDVFQAEGCVFVTGVKHSIREENTLHVFFSRELLQKA